MSKQKDEKCSYCGETECEFFENLQKEDVENAKTRDRELIDFGFAIITNKEAI